jgi:hypothetical protein
MEGAIAFLMVIWIAAAGIIGFAFGHDGFNQAKSDARFVGRCVDAAHGSVTVADSQNLCILNGKVLFTAKR